MANLKTDYKDDIIESGDKRKYSQISNSDGTISFTDETSYSQVGDTFGAKDINETNKAINRINSDPTSVTLTASGWIGSAAPYSQTVEVEGVTAEDNPIFVSLLADGASADTQKAYMKAFGIIASGTGTTAEGSVTFKVYKKPATDITIGLKGV